MKVIEAKARIAKLVMRLGATYEDAEAFDTLESSFIPISGWVCVKVTKGDPRYAMVGLGGQIFDTEQGVRYALKCLLESYEGTFLENDVWSIASIGINDKG